LETKEQFSDGGYGWIDKLKEVVAVEVTDEQLQGNLFPLQTPHSKEEYYYRAIFMNIPSDAAALCAPSRGCSAVQKSH
jgi:asparagine synthase (glutamine-hydrolysing)